MPSGSSTGPAAIAGPGSAGEGADDGVDDDHSNDLTEHGVRSFEVRWCDGAVAVCSGPRRHPSDAGDRAPAGYQTDGAVQK